MMAAILGLSVLNTDSVRLNKRDTIVHCARRNDYVCVALVIKKCVQGVIVIHVDSCPHAAFNMFDRYFHLCGTLSQKFGKSACWRNVCWCGLFGTS